MNSFPYARSPCVECPWRKDVPTGKFPPERFRALAISTYDMSRKVFACHMSKEEKPFACAGFLLRGATHNLTVRLAARNGNFKCDVDSGGHPLFANYREMAIANGVAENDPSLESCRDPDPVTTETAS